MYSERFCLLPQQHHHQLDSGSPHKKNLKRTPGFALKTRLVIMMYLKDDRDDVHDEDSHGRGLNGDNGGDSDEENDHEQHDQVH